MASNHTARNTCHGSGIPTPRFHHGDKIFDRPMIGLQRHTEQPSQPVYATT